MAWALRPFIENKSPQPKKAQKKEAVIRALKGSAHKIVWTQTQETERYYHVATSTLRKSAFSTRVLYMGRDVSGRLPKQKIKEPIYIQRFFAPKATHHLPKGNRELFKEIQEEK